MTCVAGPGWTVRGTVPEKRKGTEVTSWKALWLGEGGSHCRLKQERDMEGCFEQGGPRRTGVDGYL